MAAGPIHQSMLILDVEGSGSRTDPEKQAVRRTLYQLVMAAFARAGLMWDDCRYEDRGDGVYLLIPPSTPKPMLVTTLIEAIDRLAREHGRAARALRLRAALHAGEVTLDDHGSSGYDVDLTFALVDGAVVKETLRAADRANLVVCLSDAFFRATVRHRYPGLDPEGYAAVEIATKQGPVKAWLRVPGYPKPPVPSPPGAGVTRNG